MTPHVRTALGAACIGGVGAALLLPRSAAGQKPEKVSLDKVPAKVMATANKALPKAKWMEATRETVAGEERYDLAGVLNKRLVTVEIDADGDLIEVEKQIDTADVPKPVMRAFQDKAGKAKIEAVMEVRGGFDEDEEGTITGYEFSCTRARKAGKAKTKGKAKGKGGKERKTEDERITVIVSPDGKSAEIQGEDD